MVLALESIDNFDESYSLNITFAEFKDVLIKFDMHDVLMSMQVQYDGLNISVDYDLLTDFMLMFETHVGFNNEWFHYWADCVTQPQNFPMSFVLLQNNMSKTLWNKSVESYDKYPYKQSGGHLIFIVMMHNIFQLRESY